MTSSSDKVWSDQLGKWHYEKESNQVPAIHDGTFLECPECGPVKMTPDTGSPEREAAAHRGPHLGQEGFEPDVASLPDVDVKAIKRLVAPRIVSQEARDRLHEQMHRLDPDGESIGAESSDYPYLRTAILKNPPPTPWPRTNTPYQWDLNVPGDLSAPEPESTDDDSDTVELSMFSTLNDLVAGLAFSLTNDQMIKLVIALDQYASDWDVSEALHKHFKKQHKIFKREMGE